MIRTTCSLIAMTVLMIAAVAAARAEAPATGPAGGDAGSPQERAKGLIDRLADDDFRTRDDAAQELQKLGKEALPALKEALKSSDPSVRSYAEWLVPAIERKLGIRAPGREDGDPTANDRRARGLRLVPPVGVGGGIGGPIVVGPDVRHSSITVSVNNGVKTVNVTEDDRKVSIHEDAEGITMSVTETKDGKDQTAEYKAKNAEELKKEHPEAYKMYEQYAAGGRRGEMRMRVIRGGRAGGAGAGAVGGAGVRGDIDLGRVRDQQRRMMNEVMGRAAITDEQRRMLAEQLDEAKRQQERAMAELERVRREILRDLEDLRIDDVDREMRREVERLRRELLDVPEVDPAPKAKDAPQE